MQKLLLENKMLTNTQFIKKNQKIHKDTLQNRWRVLSKKKEKEP